MAYYLRSATVQYAALAALIAGAAFLKCTVYDFTLWDDDTNVVNNPFFQPVTLHSLAHLWMHPYYGLYIPVSYMAFAALSAAAHSGHTVSQDFDTPLNPHIFHAANVVLHLFDVTMVFAILRRFIKRDVPAVFGALLFALHPLQVESVAWISELRGLLGAAFGLSSMYVYLHGIQSSADRRICFNIPAMGLFVLSLLCKPSELVIPLVLLIWAWYETRQLRVFALGLLPWFALDLGDIILTRHVQQTSQVPALPFSSRCVVALDSYGFYLQKLVWPANLVAEYGRTPDRVLQGHLQVWTILAVLTAAAVVAVRFRKEPWALLCALTFGAVLAPVSGLIPFAYQFHSTVADRYVYLAMLGPAMAVAFCLNAVADRTSYNTTQWAAAALLVLLTVRTEQQITTWRNTETLFGHVLTVNPHDYIPHLALGSELLEQGQNSAAEAQFKTVLRWGCYDPNIWTNLGESVQRQGRLSEAVVDYDKALAMSPGFGIALYGRAQCEALSGHLDASVKDYRSALAVLPRSTNADEELAMELYYAGRYPDAIVAFTRTVWLHPDYLPEYYYLAHCYEKMGRPKLANDIATVALARDPNDALMFQFVSVASVPQQLAAGPLAH